MVEEFMLLANISVAKKTLQEFPNCALLRRHPAPPANSFDPVVQVATSKVWYYPCKMPIWHFYILLMCFQ